MFLVKKKYNYISLSCKKSKLCDDVKCPYCTYLNIHFIVDNAYMLKRHVMWRLNILITTKDNLKNRLDKHVEYYSIIVNGFECHLYVIIERALCNDPPELARTICSRTNKPSPSRSLATQARCALSFSPRARLPRHSQPIGGHLVLPREQATVRTLITITRRRHLAARGCRSCARCAKLTSARLI